MERFSSPETLKILKIFKIFSNSSILFYFWKLKFCFRFFLIAMVKRFRKIFIPKKTKICSILSNKDPHNAVRRAMDGLLAVHFFLRAFVYLKENNILLI